MADDPLRKKLDEVVGTRYDERGEPWRLPWLRKSVRKWLAGAVLAVLMAIAIWRVLDHYLVAAHQNPRQDQRPVIIQILPAR